MASARVERYIQQCTGVNPRIRGETDNAYRERLVLGLNSLADAQYDALPPPVQEWFGSAVAANNEKKPAPAFPDDTNLDPGYDDEHAAALKTMMSGESPATDIPPEGTEVAEEAPVATEEPAAEEVVATTPDEPVDDAPMDEPVAEEPAPAPTPAPKPQPTAVLRTVPKPIPAPATRLVATQPGKPAPAPVTKPIAAPVKAVDPRATPIKPVVKPTPTPTVTQTKPNPATQPPRPVTSPKPVVATATSSVQAQPKTAVHPDVVPQKGVQRRIIELFLENTEKTVAEFEAQLTAENFKIARTTVPNVVDFMTVVKKVMDANGIVFAPKSA